MSTKNNKHVLRPGQTAEVSGQYEMFGPRGGRTGIERTLPAGTVAPPTKKPGMTLRLVDKTKTTGR